MESHIVGFKGKERSEMELKVVGFVWNVDGDEFVHMVELKRWKRKLIEFLLRKYETDGESFPLIREE